MHSKFRTNLTMPNNDYLRYYPTKLRPYQNLLENNAKEFIRIKLKEVSVNTTLTQSKVGGLPYFPLSMEYPHHPESGDAMILLAQFNFEEIPPLEGFPTTGILQFFISPDDEYGFNEGGHQVIYHPKLDDTKLISDFSFLTEMLKREKLDYEFFSPLTLNNQETYALEFIKDQGIVNVQDIQFEQLLGEASRDLVSGEGRKEVWDFLHKKGKADGHKLGGYAFFTQDDPRREDLEKYGQYQLLFQLDSEIVHKPNGQRWDKVLWGDVGIGNFFIHPDDLKNLDFSRTLYYWDCG